MEAQRTSEPTSVWKYLSPETALLVLGNRTLRFSPLTALNDRRDCAFDLTDEIAYIKGLYKFVDKSPPDRPRDPADTPERTIERNLRKQLRASGFRILSLSLNAPYAVVAEPMWGYYGASAQGICLELNYGGLISALREDLRRGEQLGYATPHETGMVVYKNRVPKYPHGPSEGEATGARIKEAIFRKDETWRHENEYRIVIAIDKDAPERSILALPHFTWVFPKSVVSKIYLGEYSSEETIEMVTAIADGIPIQLQM